jgi:hypothetical protein
MPWPNELVQLFVLVQCYMFSCCDLLVRAHRVIYVGDAFRILASTSKARAHLFRTLVCNSINTVTKNTCVCTVGSCMTCVTKPQGDRTIENTRNARQLTTLRTGQSTRFRSARITLYAQNIPPPYTTQIVHFTHRPKEHIRVYIYMLRIHSQLERGVMIRRCVCAWETS